MTFQNQIVRAWIAAAFGALLASGLGVLLHFYTVGSGLMNLSYDLLIVARGHLPASEAVIVYLDEISHQKLQQPLNAPWDRAIHAQLIDRLTAAGARAIVFDIVFSDPNPNQPAADQRLASAIKSSGRVILAADNVPTGPGTHEIIPPLPLLRDRAAGVGSAEVIPSRDLIVREHTPEDLLPSLSWAAAEYLGASVTKDEKQRTAQRWMNYYGPPNEIPWRRYHEALDPAVVGDEFFRGKVVFVGARIMTKFSGERKDEYRNPFSFWLSQSMVQERSAAFVAGVEIQATAFLNLFRGDWLRRWPLPVERWLIAALGIIFGVGLIRVRPVLATGLAFATLVAVMGAVYFAVRQNLLWFPWLIVVVQIAAALFWSILYNSIQLYVQKRMYEYTLGLYLSPKLVRKFSKDASLLKPGAEEIRLTIFFSDIADFTSISQRLDSGALARLMNNYFQTAVANCIHKTDGTVVKYIGDAIFAFWNAPEGQADHEMRACEAALRFRDEVVQTVNGQPLRTRVGIHTGIARVGNFGSRDRVDYTALGESVNLASRLEGLNKYLGTETLITQETRKGVGDRLVTRAVGWFRLKGFDTPVEACELVGWLDKAEATRPWREAFAEGLRGYNEKKFDAAADAFRRVLELKPDDGPANYYLARMTELKTKALPEEWTGEIELKEK